ncbi:alpha-amylase family glycosyl hydrolase [Halomarina oriensis]|uniref:DUF3459 domain-containing protein n=1 Tax=Halomarina oriensis TaxID=671145 RepID=A0A6B0GX02_9EURY|nr:alpha-amylase family glycosyl hydrolase [Halomarina oriensis]MWG36288.1 DUF3459 domain-containing protein [Halomarina oriensis]
MHHPGPPRFTTVGKSVELAPRNPPEDAGDAFRWRLTVAPESSDVLLDAGPVAHLAPDVPGTYRVELDAPDGTHRQTIRAFPDDRRDVRFRVDEDDVEGDVSGVERCSVIAAFNDFTTGVLFAEREGEGWAVDVALPPGDHDAIFTFDDGWEHWASDGVTVEGPGRPRLALDGHVEDGSVVVAADAAAAPNGDDPSVEFHLDDRDGLTDDAVEIADDELRVPLAALPDDETVRVHAVPVAERHGVADTVELRRVGDDVHVAVPGSPPEWTRDATMYQIFVRSFCGDTLETTFAELERRVAYVESLGVDTVWLTPVLASPTTHGYHITDLFDTAADLGTRAEFESLVDRFHEAGIRVVFDLVVNHTSRDHPAFQLHRAGVEEYADHYERVPREADTTGVDWAGEDAPGVYFNWARIPNVNYDSLAVRRWMLDVVDEWAPVVDGFRCDVAWGVPHGFWKEVRERVKAHDDEFLLLDETVPRDVAFAENEFDAHYDTDLYDALRDVGTGEASADAVLDAVGDAERYGFPDDAAHMRYVENHDEERYASECETGTLRPAAAATFTLPGVPMIYYGQERGVPEQRGPMRWHDGDADLTDYHRRLVALRDAFPVLREGTVEPVDVDVLEGATERVVAYARTDEDATGDSSDDLLVVLNFADEPVRVAVDGGATDLLADEDFSDDGDSSDDGPLVVEDAAVVRY